MRAWAFDLGAGVLAGASLCGAIFGVVTAAAGGGASAVATVVVMGATAGAIVGVRAMRWWRARREWRASEPDGL